MIALALPAASVPPIIVQKTSRPNPASRRRRWPGQVARREDHRRHGRDQQQLDDPGLGQRDVGPDRVAASSAAPAVAPAARRRRPAPPPGAAAGALTRGRVVARDGQRRPASPRSRAPSATWSVCVHAASRVRTWSATDDDLDREEDGRSRPPAGRASAGRAGSARRRPRRAATISPTTAATQRCRTWRGGRVGRAAGRACRSSAASPGRPAPESRRGDVRAEQQQREGRRGAERGEQREPLAARRDRRAAPGSRRGPAGRRAARRAPAPRRGARSPTRRCCRAGPSPGPSHAWNPTSTTAAIDGQRIERRSRWSRTARTASPRISKPMSAATVRWIHSIQAFGVVERRDSWP